MSIYPSPGILGIACTCILAVGGGGCKGPVCEKTISGQTIHFISSFQTLNNILPPQQGEQTSARVKVNCTSGGEDAAFFSGFWTLKLTLGTRSVLKLSAVGKKNKKSMISQPVNMPNGRTILESLSGFSKSQICFKIKKIIIIKQNHHQCWKTTPYERFLPPGPLKMGNYREPTGRAGRHSVLLLGLAQTSPHTSWAAPWQSEQTAFTRTW